MKSITSRLNTFLAKIAGRNVDIGTLTPPVAVNATEELLLEIAERVDDVSSVPEIEEGDVGKILTAGEDGAVWASGGGGGSGLPDYTNARNRDSLSVKVTAAPTELPFVNEQTVTLDNSRAFLTPVSGWLEHFTVGNTVNATVNGVQKTGTIKVGELGTVYVSLGGYECTISIYYEDEVPSKLQLYYEGDSPTTISATIEGTIATRSLSWTPPVLTVIANYSNGAFVIDQPLEPFKTAVEDGAPIMLVLANGSEKNFLYVNGADYTTDVYWECYAQRTYIDEEGTVNLTDVVFGAEPYEDDPGWFCEATDYTFYGLSDTAHNQ